MNLLTEIIQGLKALPIIEIDGNLYHEMIDFNCLLNFDDLGPFTEEHELEAKKVLLGKQSDRYSPDYHLGYINYFEEVVKELNRDNNSRRAIMKFVSIPTITQPCLISLQFLIRNNKLNVIANLRSSELNNFLPYDICLIKMITENIKSNLDHKNIELNNIFINAASAHILAK
jgi:thymidylate synthase